MTEEDKHVDQLLKSTKLLENMAKNVESKYYPAKFLCKVDCWGLKTESWLTNWWPGFAEKIPGFSPHPHDYD